MEQMKATIVDFSNGGDGNRALYINEDLELNGDYYHDKIDEHIDGFIKGIEYALGIDIERVKVSISNESPLVNEDGWCDNVPKRLEQLELEKYKI